METSLLLKTPLVEDAPDRWMRYKFYSRLALSIAYFLLALVTALMVWQMVALKAEKSSWAVATSAVAVLIAIPLSLFDMNIHLQNYVSPLQRHYIRIMGMVPIYAMESWLALTFRQQRVYLETAREAYEAFVIYSFFRLMVEALGGRRAVVELSLQKQPAELPFFYPLNWVLPRSFQWSRGEVFVYRCERGVFQYVLLRVLLAVLAAGAEWGGVLCESFLESPAHCAYPWLNSALLVSQSWAMYCLVWFWHENMVELQPMRAASKLLAVKAVVFFTFIQGLAISGLIYIGVITATNSFSVVDLGASLQNFLICWEMALAAVAHHYIFNRREFKEGGALPGHSGGRRIAASAAFIATMPHDVVQEAEAVSRDAAQQVRSSIKKAGESAASKILAATGGRGGGSPTQAAEERPMAAEGSSSSDSGDQQ